MKVLITGTSQGIGRATALYFLDKGMEVIGLDLLESSINHEKYTHYICDIKNKESLPKLYDIAYIFNNAGLQNCIDDIDNNLKGSINVTEKYAFQPSIKSVLFNASASSISGDEFPLYAASKAGLIGYMRNTAMRLIKQKATCNAISLGGVMSKSNESVINDKESWNKIMEATPLKKWMSEEEVAEWVYFLLVINKSMSGENLLIDNGEYRLNSSFVWKS